MRSLIALLTLLAVSPDQPALPQTDPPAKKPIVEQNSYRYRVLGVVVRGVTVTEVIQLRYMDTASVAERLRLQLSRKENTAASGSAVQRAIESIIEDQRTNSLIIKGTPEAVATIRKAISGLDVPVRSVTVQFNVLRFDFDAEGDWDVQVVSRPTIKTLQDSPATISQRGDGNAFSAEITPHINADGTIEIDGSLRAAGQRSTFRRTMTARTKAILTGVTDSASATVRKSAAAGRIPSGNGEPFTVFFLQLVSVQEDPPAR